MIISPLRRDAATALRLLGGPMKYIGLKVVVIIEHGQRFVTDNAIQGIVGDDHIML